MILSYTQRLAPLVARIHASYAEQCGDAGYTQFGRVILAAKRAIVVSGWAVMIFVTLGVLPGIIAALFVGMGEGNGFAWALFAVLIVAGVAYMWNRRRQRNA